MNSNLSLFDNYLNFKSLDDKESKLFETYRHVMLGAAATPKDLHLPQNVTLPFISSVIKTAYETRFHTKSSSWACMAKALLGTDTLQKVEQLALKHFLLLEIAKDQSLGSISTASERLDLAYKAIHGHQEHKNTFLTKAKHFELNDAQILQDLAFKGILLSNPLEIDIREFLPQDEKVIKELLLSIFQKSEALCVREFEKVKKFIPAFDLTF